MENIYSVKDCAREIGRSEQYVRALIRGGMLEAQCLSRAFMIHKNEVDRIKHNLPLLGRDAYCSKGNT